jgi:hypothetical protein
MKRKKRRVAAPHAQPGMRSSRKPVKKDFLADGPARIAACLWAISLTFAYGVVNDLVLHRPERKVSVEALCLCLATLLGYVALFYSRPTYASVYSRFTERTWEALDQLEQRRFGRLAGATVLAFVLVVTMTPIGNVEPVLAAEHLRRSNVGLLPGIDSDLRGTDPAYRFRQVSKRLEKAIQEGVPGDPEKLNKVQASLAEIVENVRLPEKVSQSAQLELAYLQTYETFSQIGTKNLQPLHQTADTRTGLPTTGLQGAGVDKTILNILTAGPFRVRKGPFLLSSFTVILAGDDPSDFLVAEEPGTSIVTYNVKIERFAQDIGNLTWTSVTFQGSAIRYHGQPLQMGDVRFVDCTFERSPDGKGQEVLDYLSAHQGESVNVYVP